MAFPPVPARCCELHTEGFQFASEGLRIGQVAGYPETPALEEHLKVGHKVAFRASLPFRTTAQLSTGKRSWLSKIGALEL